jgi:hypothetical protein
MSSATPVTPNVADSLESLAAMLTDAAKGLRRGTSASPEQHAGLVESLKRVVELVHGPRDDIMDIMTGFCQIAVIRLFIKWKVFEKIPAAGIISYKELAAAVGADVSLISEITQESCA